MELTDSKRGYGSVFYFFLSFCQILQSLLLTAGNNSIQSSDCFHLLLSRLRLSQRASCFWHTHEILVSWPHVAVCRTSPRQFCPGISSNGSSLNHGVEPRCGWLRCLLYCLTQMSYIGVGAVPRGVAPVCSLELLETREIPRSLSRYIRTWTRCLRIQLFGWVVARAALKAVFKGVDKKQTT